MKKEMELEKQQRMTTELESTIQEAKQDKSRAECGALRAEIQKLKDNLEDAQQQQKLAGEALSRRCPHHTSNPRSGLGQSPLFLWRPLPAPFPAPHCRPCHDLMAHLTGITAPARAPSLALNWEGELLNVQRLLFPQQRPLKFTFRHHREDRARNFTLCSAFLPNFSRTSVTQFILPFL